MDRTRPLSTFLIVLACMSGSATAQGDTVNASFRKGPTKFDRSELEERLDSFKTKIARKCVTKNVRKKGEKRIEKWLRGFQVVQSEHYLVYTNGPKTTVKRFAKSLEELYDFVRALWPFEHIDHHLSAYVFASKEEYVAFCVNITGWSERAARGTAGHANGAYYATYYQSPKSKTVMHEATHQIVHACLRVPGVGSWFQEGMAVYVQNGILGGKVSGSMRTDLRNGHYYPMPEFIAIRSLISDEHSRRNYVHSGCVIEFMMKTKDQRMKGKFTEFMKAARRQYGRGAGVSERLFRAVYGMTAEEVNDAFLAFHGVKPDKKKSKKTREGAGR